MAKRGRIGAAVALAALLTSCGGGSDSGGGGMVMPSPTPTPTPVSTPTPTPVAGCSLRERQDWVAAQMREWYLFPETLPASLDPGLYPTVDSYLDALTATARSQGRDRYFTYLTSITEENAYYESGASAGFGFRLGLGGQRLFIIESFEGGPSLNAGIDRGAEILAIGAATANLRNVSDIMASEGSAGLTDALGPDTAGTSRVLRIADAGGTRTVTLTKTEFALAPVSTRYGAKVLDDGGRKIGYVNLRTFIETADPALRQAFANFRAQGITQFIVDLRYNGGGLISIADLMGDLMGGNRSASDVYRYMTFRPEKAAENETYLFHPQEPQAVSPTKIAFIGSNGTASASELVINGFLPYLHANMALVGTNTYGKPVGQIALDQSGCDDRLRVIAFALENSAHQGSYFNGLAGTVEASCQASDDIGYPLGDPREASTKAALDFLAGRSCSRIGTASAATRELKVGAPGGRELLAPTRPSTMQREVPGAF